MVERFRVLLGFCGAFALASTAAAASPDRERAAMVREIGHTAREYGELRRDPHFAAAVQVIRTIPREAFVPPEYRAYAYQDRPLPIGYDQTISDPYIVAVMTAAARIGPGTSVLDIGTGSGYQAAVLSRLGATVHSIEIVRPLAESAAERLARLDFGTVTVRAGDGFEGWPIDGGYDAIIVAAGAADIPAPLLAQLKVGGRLVMAIGPAQPLEQLLVVTKRGDGGFDRCSLGTAMFVALTGRGQRSGEGPGIYDRTVPDCYRGQTARWPRFRAFPAVSPAASP